MENEARALAWFADFYRAGYEAYVRFMWAFYGGEPTARAVEVAYLESLLNPAPRDVQEKAP